MADDLIDEWKRASAPPAPGKPARTATPAHAADDLIGEWMRTLPPHLQDAAAVTPAPGPRPEDDPDQFIRGNAAFFRSVRESRGHGTPTITDLVTGHRPDSWGDVLYRRTAEGAKGIHDVAATISQGVDYLKETGAQALADRGYIDPETARDIAAARAKRNESISRFNRYWDEANAGTPVEWGRIGGQILGTAPMLGTGALALRTLPGAARAAQWAAANPRWAAVVQGGTTGAAANVLTSSASDVPVGEQAMYGAAGGAVLGPFGHYVGRLFGGAADRETAQLAQLALDKYKIPIRVDQISGNPMARFGGSVAQRTPGTGLAANVAEQQASFNRAVANTFGENADKITPGVMAGAKSRIGSAFDTTLPKLEAWLGPKVSARLQSVANATDYLAPDEARIVNKHVDDILRQFTGVGRPGAGPRMNPKGIARADGKEIQALIASGSPLDRSINGSSSNVAHYASELKNILLDAVGQTPTGRAKMAAAYVQKLRAFQQARYQYKNMKTIEDLAEKATTGDVSPALLMGKVRQSFGNMAYGGGGDLADLARIGQRFLKEPPSSGTAERLTLMNLALGGAAGVAGAGAVAFDPEHFQRDAAVLAGSVLAARAGGAALKSRMLARSAVRSGQRGMPPIIGPVLSRSLPYLAPRQNPFATPASQR